jgi:hypothetical protein
MDKELIVVTEYKDFNSNSLMETKLSYSVNQVMELMLLLVSFPFLRI